MKATNGIIICKCLCESEIDGTDYWEHLAFEINDLSSIRSRNCSLSGENTSAIYMKSGESFVIDVAANVLLKELKKNKTLQEQ